MCITHMNTFTMGSCSCFLFLFSRDMSSAPTTPPSVDKVDGFSRKSVRKARQKRSQSSSQFRSQGKPIELTPLPLLKGETREWAPLSYLPHPPVSSECFTSVHLFTCCTVKGRERGFRPTSSWMWPGLPNLLSKGFIWRDLSSYRWILELSWKTKWQKCRFSPSQHWCLCVCVCVLEHYAHVTIRGQLVGVGSLLPPRGS